MNSLRLIYRKYNTDYKINKGKSSLTSLVACFILGITYFRCACGLGYILLFERYPKRKTILQPPLAFGIPTLKHIRVLRIFKLYLRIAIHVAVFT
jgi:hypothetical protein